MHIDDLPEGSDLFAIEFRPPEPGETAQKGTVIGYQVCSTCHATIAVKLNVNLKAYSYCNAHVDDTKCDGDKGKFNASLSKWLIRQWAKSARTGITNARAAYEAEKSAEKAADQETGDDTGTGSPPETARDAPGEPDSTGTPETEGTGAGVTPEPRKRRVGLF